jgi:hypothetical protein
MAWIFVVVVILFSAIGTILQKRRLLSNETLMLGGLALGFLYWIAVSLLPR